MRDETGATREQCHDYGECGTWIAEHLNCKQGAADRANDSVDRVPGRIEPWNFVREKFQEVEDARDCDDPRVPEDLERLILWRQRDPMEMDGESSGENREIKVDPGQASQAERDRKDVQLLHAESIGAGENGASLRLAI